MNDDSNRINPSLAPLTIAGLAPVHAEIRYRLAQGWNDMQVVARLKRFFRLSTNQAQVEISSVRLQKARPIIEPEAKVIDINRRSR